MPSTFTIANGASLSNSLRLGGLVPVGVIMPAAWTAAGLSFAVSQDDSTYYPIFDDAGAEITATVAASEFIIFTNIARLFGITPDLYLKLRSGTSAVAVNQGAARVLTLVGFVP